jgi:hypothetical protein
MPCPQRKKTAGAVRPLERGPQWTWLAEQLTVPAELRLLVSSVQVVADGHGWERWGNLPLQRQQLYDLIRTTGADRVVVLSGDRHVGAIYRETQGLPYPLIEITTSGITQGRPVRSGWGRCMGRSISAPSRSIGGRSA